MQQFKVTQTVNVFTISDEQQQRIHKWLKEDVYPVAIALQRLGQALDDRPEALIAWKEGRPLCVATGQQVTYSFTPIRGGVIVRVIEPWTRKELDLTDYDAIRAQVTEEMA